MIREDARGRRVIIVADYLVNPDSALYASITSRPGPVLDVLIKDGWGIMKTPPHVLGENVGRPAVNNIAGDAVDYLHHNYTVMVLAAAELPHGGMWLDLLDAAFRELGTPMPHVVCLHNGDGSGTATAAGIRAALAAGIANGAVPPA